MQIEWREKERENEKSRRRSVRILMTPLLLPADERDHNQRGMNLINEQPRGEPRRKGPLSLRDTNLDRPQSREGFDVCRNWLLRKIKLKINRPSLIIKVGGDKYHPERFF
jgi:hypothetical protein